MKKLLVSLLAVMLAVTCVACGSKDTKENGSSLEIQDSNEILTKAFESYNEAVSDDMKLNVIGGNTATASMDGPAKFDLEAEGAVEEFATRFCVPEEAIALIDDASAMAHAMMANNFTASAVHVTDKANAETVISGIKETAKTTNWICGVPETLVIYTVGDEYVVSVFGAGDIIAGFKTAMETAYGEAAVAAAEESLW